MVFAFHSKRYFPRPERVGQAKHIINECRMRWFGTKLKAVFSLDDCFA